VTVKARRLEERFGLRPVETEFSRRLCERIEERRRSGNVPAIREPLQEFPEKLWRRQGSHDDLGQGAIAQTSCSAY
jgi:hypothetical protein